MIFITDPNAADLFHIDLFPELRPDDTFYVLVEGPVSPTRIEQIKSMFTTPTSVKVVFVKEFSDASIERFAKQKGDTTVVDLRPSEIMKQTHLLPPHISRAILRETSDPRTRAVIPRMILETITALVHGLKISDEFVVLREIQKRFEEHLEIELDSDSAPFDPHIHSRWCSPTDHVRILTDSDGVVWPYDTRFAQNAHSVISKLDFGELTFLAEHAEIEAEYNSRPGTDDTVDVSIVPVDVRKFIATRASANRRFKSAAIQTCPEFELVRKMTDSLENEGPLDIFVEPRADISVQTFVLQEIFTEYMSPGGMMYFTNPDYQLTVMLSTWNTPVPLGSLYGNLGDVFRKFGSFHLFENGAIAVTRRVD
jgi:hypothetical protein